MHTETNDKAKPIIYLGTTILGIYGADLHKLMLSILSLMIGHPLILTTYGRFSDMAMVVLLICITGVILIAQPNRLFTLLNIPFVLMVCMGFLVAFSLINYYDESCVEWFYRFMAGNLLLFFSSVIICTKLSNTRLLLLIWVCTSLVMAVCVICLTLIGITWTSGRSNLIQGVGIRSGYFSALSVIYIVTHLLCRFKSYQEFLLLMPILIILVLGCLVSGSKASILLMILGISIIYCIKWAKFRKHSVGNSIAIIGLIILSVGIFFLVLPKLIDAGIDIGFLSQSAEYQSYQEAFQDRFNLALEYINYGSQHFFFGRGISSAYNLDIRTHSALTSFFVQFGIVGVALYLCWLLGPLWVMWLKVISSSFRSFSIVYKELAIFSLTAVVFLAIKAEITGDLPGNRELWLFNGVLLSLINIHRSNQIKILI